MKKICHIFLILLFIFFIVGCKTPDGPPRDDSGDLEQQQNPSEPQESEDPDNKENQDDNKNQSSINNQENTENREEEIEELYIEEYDNEIIVGEGNYEEFYKRTSNKEKLILKVKKTYILDPDYYSKEYYEQIKDDYPMIVEYVVTFDGEVYKVKSSSEIEKIYKYLKYSVAPLNHRDDLRVAMTYLFTNDEYMTYELYERYSLSSQWEDVLKAFSSYLFVFKVSQVITYERSNFLNINYTYDKNIAMSKEKEQELFYYLDNLMWGQLENVNSNNYTPSGNIINLSTLRTVKHTVFEDSPLELNKEYQLDYVIDIDNSVVNLIFKDNGETVYSIFADSESLKLKELLEELNIDFRYTYIEPSNYYGTISDDYIVNVEMDEDNITFIFKYKLEMIEINGKYKVFGNKLLCELDMDIPGDGYYSMETYLFTYTINEEGIEHHTPYAREWFKDFSYYTTKIILKKIQE